MIWKLVGLYSTFLTTTLDFEPHIMSLNLRVSWNAKE